MVIKVVNRADEPVEGATVAIANWFGYRGILWQAQTAVDGLVVWDGAPSSHVRVCFWKPGVDTSEPPSKRTLKPQDEPHVVCVVK